MTAPATAGPHAPPGPPRRATAPARVPVWGVVAWGAGALVAAATAAVAAPGQILPVVAAGLGVPALLVAGLLLRAYPWLAPWGAVVIFSTSAELRLRVAPEVGVLKDVYLGLLIAVVGVPAVTSGLGRVREAHDRGLRAQTAAGGVVGAARVRPVRGPASALPDDRLDHERHRSGLPERGLIRDRLRPLAAPLAALGILAALYLCDPAGDHGTPWLVGTRLLLSVLALLLVGLVCVRPQEVATHLVRATAAVLAFEAVFAWIQQCAGFDTLVFGWGYEYGAQVRGTSDGGLRVSGTFEDPFQLAALAVLGVTLGLFVASRRLRAVLVVSGLAVLAATSVRTAAVQVAVLLVVLVVRRGWGRQAAVLGAVATVAGIYLLATTTASDRPGAPEVPLLFGLNGRSTAWAQAVQGPGSFVIGNGVGARGIGSTRRSVSVSAVPAYSPNTAPIPVYAGDPAFLDSTYAQVQSDVGIVGTLALVVGLAGLVAVLVRRCGRDPRDGPGWGALAVLAVSLVDWVGRSSLVSYTTGFLTTYVLGVLVAASLARERTS